MRENDDDNNLTDDELNELLLSDEPVRTIKDPNQSKDESNLNHLIKKKKVKKPESEKKPSGRKIKWTEEKILEDKNRKKEEAQIRRDNRKLQERINKLTLNQGYGDAERYNVSEQLKVHKKLIEDELLKQREKEKEINDCILFKCTCECIDKFSYIDPRGYIISECMYCSRKREWDPVSWERYWYKTKGELQCKKIK